MLGRTRSTARNRRERERERKLSQKYLVTRCREILIKKMTNII